MKIITLTQEQRDEIIESKNEIEKDYILNMNSLIKKFQNGLEKNNSHNLGLQTKPR